MRRKMIHNRMKAPRRVMAFVLVALAVVGAVAAWPAIAMAGGVLAVKSAGAKFMFAVPAMVVAKNGKANEFRAQAAAIRAELMDATKTFTKDEIEGRAAQIAALETRAATVAEFTPGDEIDRQNGVDGEGRRVSVDDVNTDPQARDFNEQMAEIAKRVRRVFGGPNGYLRDLGRRTKERLSDNKEALIREITTLQNRAGIGMETRSTIIGDTGNVSGGEFLLPLQQVQSIFQVQNETMGLVQHALRFPVSGRTLRIPYVVQDQIKDGAGNLIDRPLAGIANVGIIGEGDEKPEREPTFNQRLLTVYKVAAYSEIGDETLGDDFTGDLAPTVQRLVGGQTLNYINELVTMDGTGTAMPLGALNVANNPAALGVERATLEQISSDDVFQMFSKHTFGGGQSFWLIHRTAIPQLFALKLSGNTLVTFLPNLQGAPQMTLLGLPIYMTDLTAQLGSDGDLALVNGGFYALAIRQALTVESSIHYKFRNDITAYRFITRAGGIPIPTAPYAYKAKGETHTGAKHPAARIAEHSPFVYLTHAAVAS